MDEKEKTISVFNEGVAQIQRLDNIWKDLRKNREAGNLEKCKWILDSAEVELSDDIYKQDDENEEKEDGYQSKLKLINAEINKLKKSDGNYLSQLYTLLIKKEMFLRRMQRLAGKGGKDRPADEDEMD